MTQQKVIKKEAIYQSIHQLRMLGDHTSWDQPTGLAQLTTQMPFQKTRQSDEEEGERAKTAVRSRTLATTSLDSRLTTVQYYCQPPEEH